MKNKKIIAISFILLLIPILVGIVFYNKMPDILPTHFDINGVPDKYSSKFSALFWLPAFMILIQVFMIFMLNKDPRKNYQSEKLYTISLLIIPILNLVITYVTISYGLGSKIDIVKILMFAMGILFLVIGNFLPKSKRNYTMGIRTQWTLSNDFIWEKTHRLGGFTFVIAGFITLISSFISSGLGYKIALASIFLAAIIPTVYSYLLYEKLKKESKE